MRFNNLRMLRLGRPFALVAAAFSILVLTVLDLVLLAGGPLVCVLLLHVVGWLTLGSGCLSSILRLPGFLSPVPKCCV